MTRAPARKPRLGPPATCCQFARRVPEGDTHERDVCSVCGHIHYINPRIVTASVCSWNGQILLARRAIEPRVGFWVTPGGYLELGETVEDAAQREALEEAGADIAIERVLAIFDLPHAGQVQIIFRAALRAPTISAGIESLEVKLFDWADIPWGDLAWPTVAWSLRAHHAALGRIDFPPFRNEV